MARGDYRAVLVSKENHTWIIEEKTSKIAKKLEMIELVKRDPTRTTQ